MKAESKAEKELARDVALGNEAKIDESWDEAERTVRGDFLAAMMLGEALDGGGHPVTVHKRGLRLKGAVIDGRVNLEGVRDPAGDALLPALLLTDCDMPGGLDFSHSRIARLKIEGGTTGEIWGLHAHVAGTFVMQHGKFGAVNLDGTTIDKSVFLGTDVPMDAMAQTRFIGPVRLMSTIIGGDVVCSGGRFDDGIDLSRAKVTGGVVLRTDDPRIPFLAGEQVILQDAMIGGPVEGDGGRCLKGINAQEAQIAGTIMLRARYGRPFVAQGPVNFLGATIKGSIDGKGGWFFGGMGIVHSHIDGTVKFGIRDSVPSNSIPSISIPSIVDNLLDAENATIGGGLVLTGGVHSGALDMRGAVIAGRFENKGFWRAQGQQETKELLRQLAHARRVDIKLFTDDLNGEAAKTAREEAVAPYREAMRLLKQNSTDALPKGLFDLTDARVGTLADHPLHGWPGPEGLLKLNGFRYDRMELIGGVDSRWRWLWRQWAGETADEFSRRVRGGADNKGLLAPMWQRRLIWLRHQFKGLEPRRGAFHPQPYEQLATTLRAMGRGFDANQIAFETRRYRITCKVDGWWSRWARRLLIMVWKIGYPPGRVFFSLAVYFVFGAGLAGLADAGGYFAVAEGAPKGTEISQFYPSLYAIDVATPFIEFGPEGSFTVTPKAPWWFGLGHMVYRLMGWVLESIAIFTLTGLMRRD